MRNFKIYMKNNRANNILVVMSTMITAILSIINVKLIKNIFNVGILGNNFGFLKSEVVKLILISAILLVFSLLNVFIDSKAYWKGINNFIHDVLESIYKSDYKKYFLKSNPAALWGEVNITTSYSGQYYRNMIKAFYGMIKFIIYFVCLSYINLYAAFITVFVIGISSYLVGKIRDKVNASVMAYISSMKTLQGKSFEIIGGIKNIKAKNKSEFFIEKLETAQNQLSKKTIEREFLLKVAENFMIFISNIVPVIAVSVIFINSDMFSGVSGNIVEFYAFMPIVLSCMQNLYSSIMGMQSSKVHLNKLNEFQNRDREVLGDIKIEDFLTLEISDLELVLDNKKVIKFPDMTMKKGDRFVLSGESGCGKSTLFNILFGFINEYSGEVKVNGIDLRNINIKSLREVFGISFQEAKLFTMSMEDNIKLSSKNDIDYVLKTCEIEHVNKGGNDESVNQNELSGGEKARLSLARSLMKKPKLLFIDETLSSVDEDMEKRILQRIKDTYEDISIIYISHRKVADGILDKEIRFSEPRFNLQ